MGFNGDSNKPVCSITPLQKLWLSNVLFDATWILLLDIDECMLNVDNCGSNSACQNTIGSYICIRAPVETCPPGYRFDDYQQICSGK